MRPVRLEMEGFGTFRERTEVDFTALDLVAFVGPTGSGKSTVIDALTFALYGSVPRYDNPALVAPAIHQLAVEARVRLTFELAGRTYLATRVVRRGKAEGRATTREARLERMEPDGQTRVLAGNVKELDEQVRDLIGLDFAQFTRTIVLPQGDFARFIKGSAAERQELLSQLLDLQVFARMGALARDRAKEAGQRVDALDERLARLAHATPEAAAALEAHCAALDVLAGQAGAALAEVEQIEADLVARRQQVAALDDALARLQAVAVPPELARHDDELAAAAWALAAATAARDEARTAQEAARAGAEAAGDRVEIERLIARRRELAELEGAAVALEAELETARGVHRAAGEAVAEREEEAEAALAGLRAARTGADAAAWIAQLVPGNPCPVCAQVVTEVPHHVTDEDLARAEADAGRCQRALNAAAAAEAKALGRVQSLEADAAQRSKAAAALAERLESVAPLTELEAALGGAVAAAEQARAAETALRRAEEGLAGADAAHRRLLEAETVWGRSFLAQRDQVATLAPPPPGSGSLRADWDELVAWASAQRQGREGERAEVAAAGKELAGAKAAVLDRLRAEARAAGVEAEPERLPVAVAERAATARAGLDRLRAEMAERVELADRVGELSRHRTLHEALGLHLQANRFESWLLAEALADIVDRANVRLAELSDGRYSLEVVDRVFAVRDHGNADERRDIKTLSGGEIFLASLALALALADSIAELAPVDSPRLESIFLDEGFGTLDADTLDVLASAIEELSAGGRLVAIVTHVRDLAERMPVRFEVRKGPATSVIERTEG
ncbi:MAG: SMC family ATPase [Acidimicrobiales bacterium]